MSSLLSSSARYLSNLVGDKTECIMLAHLSEENNTETIAYQTLLERLDEQNFNINKIIIAKQDEVTEEVFV